MSFWEEYTERNIDPKNDRSVFWHGIIDKYDPAKVLEMGCGDGKNLKWINNPEKWGIDCCEKAIHLLPDDVHGVWGDVLDMPLKNGWFDFVFCVGLLIHIDPINLDKILENICDSTSTKGHFLIAEYYEEDWCQIPYRGTVLYKGPWDKAVEDLFEIEPVEEGFLTKKDGFDNVRYWIWKQPFL